VDIISYIHYTLKVNILWFFHQFFFNEINICNKIASYNWSHKHPIRTYNHHYMYLVALKYPPIKDWYVGINALKLSKKKMDLDEFCSRDEAKSQMVEIGWSTLAKEWPYLCQISTSLIFKQHHSCFLANEWQRIFKF